MNLEFPVVGDREIDEKVKEWLQWDKVFCIIATYCLLGLTNSAS
jgi:hypothetical protein